MDEAIRKRCKDEIGKLLAFIETTSGKRLSMSMIVNMQTGEQSSPVKRLEDWLYQFYRAAYADGQRAGMERAAAVVKAWGIAGQTIEPMKTNAGKFAGLLAQQIEQEIRHAAGEVTGG